MPWRDPPNRSAQYRARADEARTQADAATDEESPKRLLQDADTWERMAAYEDKHNPQRPILRFRHLAVTRRTLTVLGPTQRPACFP